MKTTNIQLAQVEPAASRLAALDEDALVIAMTVVPELYSRNKMFSLFSDPRLRRARKRAIALRAAVRQISGGAAKNVTIEKSGRGFALSYDLPLLRYHRVIALSDVERACVTFLLDRAKYRDLPCSEADRALVDATLVRLVPEEEPEAARASGE